MEAILILLKKTFQIFC